MSIINIIGKRKYQRPTPGETFSDTQPPASQKLWVDDYSTHLHSLPSDLPGFTWVKIYSFW